MKASKISELLSKINGTVENPQFPAVSKIERDLLMQHVRDLYEELHAVITPATTRAETPQTAQKETAAHPEVTIKKSVMHTNDNLLLNEQPPVQKPTEQPKVETVKTEPVKVEVKAVVEEKAVMQTSEVKTQRTIQTTQASINESVKTNGSLNEKLKTSTSVEMHKKLASKPLKELIDLNKKFVLLNELFKGNSEAFAAAVAHIDTLPDYEAAQTFINTHLASNHFWDETKQSTRMFNKLVKLKYGVE